MKLLLRLRMMMDCRGQLIRILQVINAREEMLRQLNIFVVKGTAPNRESELRERVSELNEMTETLLTRVRELISRRRIFGYAFIYDGMDYCKVVMQEMRQLKDILL
jgi:hypothetical protein